MCLQSNLKPLIIKGYRVNFGRGLVVRGHSTLISPAVTIQREGDLKIGVKKDGSIINRSRFGVAISYDHSNIGVYTLQEEKLSFGIGYFGDRTQIIPEARELFSDEELQRGVKAYFVQRSYTAEEHGKLVRKTELVAIPLTYEDSHTNSRSVIE